MCAFFSGATSGARASATQAADSQQLLPWADGRTRPLSRRKGLSNELGENNCFLNVIIQSLWHVRSCRVLISMGDHAVHHRCGGKITKAGDARRAAADTPCLLCELEQIFILYQFSEEPVLDVDRVRVALSDVFALGDMNDATETLEAILDALHWDTLNRMLTIRRGEAVQVHHPGDLSQSMMEDASAIVCEPQCIAHLVFQMNLMELKTCTQCGETTEPLMNTDFLYRVYAQELLQHSKGKTLEEVLHLEAQGACGQDGFVSKCDNCKAKMQLSRWILTLPMVFAVSVIWSSDHVNKGEVKAWMDLLSSQSGPPKASSKKGEVGQQTLHLGNIFRLDNSSVSSDYSFRGMVCYYGRHYVGFFASRSIENGVEKERWYLFDDTRVKLVGAWADVRLRVERGGYQPTLLFYERNGLEQSKLEGIASEIHKWWNETADEEEERQKEQVGSGDAAHGENGVKESEDKMDLLAAMKESLRIRPPSSLQLPTSPIESGGVSEPSSLPANGAKNGWHDEDLFLMHKSAEDTLSKLNGILSKDRVPISADGPGDLRRTMSMSMRRSVRKRDYSFKSTKEPVVNRDEIFNDVNEEAVSKPVAQQVIPETTYGFDQSKVSAAHQNGKAAVQSTPSNEAPRGEEEEEVNVPFKMFDVVLHASDGGIGLVLEETNGSRSALANCKSAFIVSGFEVNGVGDKLAAEASGAIQKGDVLVAINGHILENEALYNVLELLWTSPNPVKLVFHRFQPWTCPRCTLLNDAKVITCGACGHTIELRNGSGGN